MKAAPFEYILADSLAHALELLERHGHEAKPIAGGQSLVPMMAMRLARPAVLLDINRLSELRQLAVRPGGVQMGATTPQRVVEHSAELARALPLVRDALRWVGHIQTRNRGTVGGSLVHADPAAELPLAAVVLDASLHLRSHAGGERRIAARDFFLGPMFTATGETECLVDLHWPVWSGEGIRTAFSEVSMRHGDFAMAAAACQLQLDADGVCRRASFGLGGLDGTPRAFPELAQQLVGRRIDARLADELAHAAVAQTEPGTDLHASADYRRHLGVVTLSRVLQQAAQGHTAALQP
ncbi:FAD binding domain-containing protein [Hydrogenophaga crocea]|uniref:Xanthine dehydrogenase family protein subunit M n=1 Tax=Hydrogenophaga crocea TaxID=2716225 RepID=A0A6G8ILR2_9BURK|nr:FAD binding domain-containing protein [Hydrogenophaga crocea]QIM53966.1 xanthine dehydrogenase family protein subunit M [Hydrogenophaga crocea]